MYCILDDKAFLKLSFLARDISDTPGFNLLVLTG